MKHVACANRMSHLIFLYREQHVDYINLKEISNTEGLYAIFDTEAQFADFYSGIKIFFLMD